MKKLKYITLFCLIANLYSREDIVPKILFKLATRERPDVVLDLLKNYYEKISHSLPFLFLISCDNNDKTMNNENMKKKLSLFKNIKVIFGESKNKIHACNRDVNNFINEFDIVVLLSDDMVPIAKNFDIKIANAMMQSFPDLDGVVNFNDGSFGDALCSLPIIGSKFYQRFNYIYYPEYVSVCCDLELNLVSKLLNKYKYFNDVIIEHRHPAFGKKQYDNLYKKNEDSLLLDHDKKILHSRVARCFDLDSSEFSQDFLLSSLDLFQHSSCQAEWSILICTLDSRMDAFCSLYSKLLQQIDKKNLHTNIEILFFRDNKKFSVGYKRNKLIEKAKGKYISFIDDDDDISDDYIQVIYNKLLKNPDCVSLHGIITFDGKNPRSFIHSLDYDSWFEKDETYYRCPNHLNPIKRDLAMQIKFPEINCGEDADWSFKLLKSGLLKKEEKVGNPYYFYQYNSQKTEAQR